MRIGDANYGHSEGVSSVCYTVDGKKIVTCGSDGEVCPVMSL